MAPARGRPCGQADFSFQERLAGPNPGSDAPGIGVQAAIRTVEWIDATYPNGVDAAVEHRRRVRAGRPLCRPIGDDDFECD